MATSSDDQSHVGSRYTIFYIIGDGLTASGMSEALWEKLLHSVSFTLDLAALGYVSN